jgi:hypothetical protein
LQIHITYRNIITVWARGRKTAREASCTSYAAAAVRRARPALSQPSPSPVPVSVMEHPRVWHRIRNLVGLRFPIHSARNIPDIALTYALAKATRTEEVVRPPAGTRGKVTGGRDDTILMFKTLVHKYICRDARYMREPSLYSALSLRTKIEGPIRHRIRIKKKISSNLALPAPCSRSKFATSRCPYASDSWYGV